MNSHVLTGKNRCIYQAFHVLMHGFSTLRIHILGPSPKIDGIVSNVHRSEHKLVI